MIFKEGRSVVFSLLVLGLCFFPVECNPPGGHDITLLSQGPEDLVLEVITPPWTLESLSGPDGEYQRVLLPDWARTGKAGHPEIGQVIPLFVLPQLGGLH